MFAPTRLPSCFAAVLYAAMALGHLFADPPATPASHKGAPSQGLTPIMRRLGYQAIPFQGRAGRFFVPATVDGLKVSLVIDTGSPLTALDWKTAAALKLPVKDEHRVVPPFGGAVRQGTSRIRNLEIGSLNIPVQHDINVTDLDRINGPTNQPDFVRCDGLLGGDLLGRYAAVIDFDSHHLFLLPPEKYRSLVEGEWQCVSIKSPAGETAIKPSGKITLTIHDQVLALESQGKRSEYRYVQSDDAALTSIEPRSASSDGTTKAHAGVVRLGTEEIVLCLAPTNSKERPKSFSIPMPGYSTFTFKRSDGLAERCPSAIRETQPSRPGELLRIRGYCESRLTQLVDRWNRVAGEVNGRACDLLIDSACANVILDQGFAKDLALKLLEGPLADTLGGPVRLAMSKDKVLLKVGEFESRNASTHVYDFKELNHKLTEMGSRRIAGVIGSNALELHGAVIDYSNAKVYLCPIENRYAERLRMDWRCVYAERDGTPLAKSDIDKWRIVGGTDAITIYQGERGIPYRYTIRQGGDQSRYASIALAPVSKSASKVVSRGIISFSADWTTLWMVIAPANQPAPSTGFATRGSKNTTMMILTRVAHGN